MGIPKILTRLKKHNGGKTLYTDMNFDNEEPIQNLYIDINQVLHSYCQGKITVERSRERLCDVLINSIEKQIKLIKPQHLLFLAFDGVPCMGKIRLQHKRRYDWSMVDKKAIRSCPMLTDAREKGSLLYQCELSPGTRTMTYVSDMLTKHVLEKLSERKSSCWNFEVILSDSNVPGEGEMKIMNFINEYSSLSCYLPTHRHAIFSTDTDIMLLSLLTHERHLFIYGKAPSEGKTGKNAASSDPSSPPSSPRGVTIGIAVHSVAGIALHSDVVSEGPTSNKPVEPVEKYKKCEISTVIRCAQKAMRIDGRTGVERCLDDFVLFLMSLGNDYLPVEADDALDIFGLFCTLYEGGDGKYITEYDEIVHTNFSVLCDKIASKEKEFFKKKGTKLLQRLRKKVQTKEARSLLKRMGFDERQVDKIVEAKEEHAILKLIAEGLLKEEHPILKSEGQLVQENDIVELLAEKIMMSYHPDMADIETWVKPYMQCHFCTWQQIRTMVSYWQWEYQATCSPFISQMKGKWEEYWQSEKKELALEPLEHLFLINSEYCSNLLPECYRKFRERPEISALFGKKAEAPANVLDKMRDLSTKDDEGDAKNVNIKFDADKILAELRKKKNTFDLSEEERKRNEVRDPILFSFSEGPILKALSEAASIRMDDVSVPKDCKGVSCKRIIMSPHDTKEAKQKWAKHLEEMDKC